MIVRMYYPEIILLVFAAVCWFWPSKNPFFAKKFKPVFLGSLGIITALICMVYYPLQDSMAYFCTALILICTLLVLLGISGDERIGGQRARMLISLLLCASTGMMLITGAQDFILILVGLEVFTVTISILLGFHRRYKYAGETGMALFIKNFFASSILVYGISLIYMCTGTTSLIQLSAAKPAVFSHPVFIIGMIFIMGGLLFKIGFAPFHAWIPDTFQGMPTVIAGYLSIVPLTAIMTVIIRIMIMLNMSMLRSTLIAVALITMSIGNLTAIFQKDMKRLLAYSSIAHAGYILAGLVMGFPQGIEAVLAYLLIFAFMNIGAFITVSILEGSEYSSSLKDYAGLAQKNLPCAIIFAICIFSLAGMPLTAGFIAKFYIVSAAIGTGYAWLAAAVVVNMVIAVYYYYKIIQKIFFDQAISHKPIPVRATAALSIVICGISILIIGIYPEFIITIARHAAQIIP